MAIGTAARRGFMIAALCSFVLSAPASAAPPVAGPAVNVAIDAPVTASSQTSASPAALATDGDGATAWCPSAASGSIVVDLGHPRSILGFGITLAGTDPSAQVSLAVGLTPLALRPVPTAPTMRTGSTTWLAVTSPAFATARFARLAVAGSTAGGACVAELRVLANDPAEAQLAFGGDMSFATNEAAVGNTYTDRGVQGLPEQILASHGWNWVRLRIWNNPPAGYSDLPSVLEMARRAHAVGMHILLDFHYSDFWADPQHQITPAAWQSEDLTQLAQSVHDYTRDVLDALNAQGTPADMIQVGNEIRNGMLWPLGEIDWTTNSGWDNLGALLRAGVAGARDAAAPMPKILIHFDQGGNFAFSSSFYDRIVAEKVPFDVIGLSYYPFWHGTLTQMRTNIDGLASRYGKPVVLAETQYAWTLADGDTTGNFLWQASQLVPNYPATPGGQLAFESDLLSAMARVPDGLGAGIFYWEPEWIPGVGWEPGAGTPNDNLTMFDFSGHALPALQYADPLLACREFAPGQLPCTF